MKFPQTFSFLNSLAAKPAALLAVLVVLAISGMAQRRDIKSLFAPVPESVSLDIEQCANGPLAAPIPCNTAGANQGYGRGNLVPSKSHYLEGDSVPIRIVMRGITTGVSYTITVGYDFTKGGLYATDYLTSFDRTEMRPGNNPCVGEVCGPEDLYPIPNDPQVLAGFDKISGTGDDIDQIEGSISCFGCDITAVSVPTFVANTSGDSSKFVTITFTANQSDIVIAYGSHISTRSDWGQGHSAIFISGSPYHNFVSSTTIPDTNNGNRDLQLSAEAVIAPATVTIVKLVNTLDTLPVGCNPGEACDPRFRSTFVFGFASSANFGVTSFNLTDTDPAEFGGGSIAKGGITAFGTANTITVTESQVLNNRFSLTNLACVGGGSNTTVDPVLRRATIVPDEGEDIVCTFTNGENITTAAPASVSGRVLNADGLPIAKAKVFVTDVATNSTYSVDTNRNGEYVIDGLETGQFYFLSVAVRGYTFADPTRTFTLNDNLTGLDFVANP
jgi:hypothetical protein